MKVVKVDRSKVMSRVWKIFKSGRYSNSFGVCLRRAWEVEKSNIAYAAKQEEIKVNTRIPNRTVETFAMFSARSSWNMNYYANNRYNGD